MAHENLPSFLPLFFLDRPWLHVRALRISSWPSLELGFGAFGGCLVFKPGGFLPCTFWTEFCSELTFLEQVFATWRLWGVGVWDHWVFSLGKGVMKMNSGDESSSSREWGVIQDLGASALTFTCDLQHSPLP